MTKKKWSDLPTKQALQEAKTRPWDDTFPDTEDGAMDCLAAQSIIKRKDMVRAIPDPSVEGVWKVIMKDGHEAIVYLKGYREPFGNIRLSNDFSDDYDD